MNTQIHGQYARHFLWFYPILAMMLGYSLANVANALPTEPQISNADINNEPNEPAIQDNPLVSQGPTSQNLVTTNNFSPEFLPAKTSIPSTLAQWKAKLVSSAASRLLPQSTFPIEQDNSFLQQPNFLVQTSPPANSTPAPESPSISPELQRLQQKFLLPEPKIDQVRTTEYISAPGSSITTPIAFGAAWRQVYGGVGFQSRTRYSDKADGAIALGFGLGDAQNFVGLDTTTAVLSVLGDDAFGRGGISFKLHRLLPEEMALAVGAENAIVWGSTDGGSAIYVVFSKFFQLTETIQEPFSQLTLTIGLGGGRFRSEDDINNGVDSSGVFGSVGLRVIEPMSVIAEWTGQDLNLGVSLSPIPEIPLTINLAGADITGNAGDGARFIMSIGYNYNFPR